MDPHLLRTFVAIARHGSFSEAARRLGYTQSAVSQHVATLEGDLGVTLLRRRPVSLTDAGARLLEHAGPLLLRLDAARADVTRLPAETAARLVVASSPLAVTRLAGPLAAARRAWPLAEVTVQVAGRETVVTGVADGTVDVGLVDGIAAPTDPLNLPDLGPMTRLAIDEEPLAVVLPPGHPLATRPGLRLADLADARWIDAPDAGIPLDRLRAAGGSAGYRPSLRYAGTDPRGLTALAAAGHGLAVLPRSAAGGTAVPLMAPRLVHRVELLHRSPLDGPAEAFAGALTG